MADILENTNKDKTYTVYEVIDDKITHLISRMWDYKELNCTDTEKEIIESWRNDLARIRTAIWKISEK